MKNDNVRIMFFGDLALNITHNRDLRMNDYNIFGNVTQLFKQADLVIGNLESPLPGDGRENLLKKPRVIANPDAFKHIAKLSPTILCLANNHMYDALETGYKKTINFLNENNISYLGAGYSAEEAHRPLIIEKKGVRFGLLNYVAKDTNPNLPENRKFELNIFDLDKTVQDLKDLYSRTNIRIVLLHWGIEYYRIPTPDQQRIAKTLSKNGANFIIGHHAHVVQQVVRYNHSLIAYSLGNFIFPNIYFGGKLYREWSNSNRKSIIVDVTVQKNGYYNYNLHKTNYTDESFYLSPNYKNQSNRITNAMMKIFSVDILWEFYYSLSRSVNIFSNYFRFFNRALSKRLRQ